MKTDDKLYLFFHQNFYSSSAIQTSMGHIPYPPPQEAGNYETEVTEGDIVRIEHPDRMSDNPPKKLVGAPLEVIDIDDSNSEVTVEFDGDRYTIPLESATRSTRTPTEIVGAVIDHFR